MTRVLAVDDDPSILALIRAVLTLERRWTVETCEGGPAGRARLDDLELPSPDVLVLDVMMPELNGFELLAWLRRHPHRYDVPVVMLTARTGLDDETEAWHLGCDAYVHKPFRATDLVETLEVVLAAGPELRIARRHRRLTELFHRPVDAP